MFTLIIYCLSLLSCLRFIIMLEWFETITTFEKIFWYISVPFTIIFLIQLVLIIAGLDGRNLGKKIKEDYSKEVSQQTVTNQTGKNGTISFGLSFFSMRSVIVFLMVFGWVGVILYHKGLANPVTVLISLCTGAVIMIILSLIFYFSQKEKK